MISSQDPRHVPMQTHQAVYGPAYRFFLKVQLASAWASFFTDCLGYDGNLG